MSTYFFLVLLCYEFGSQSFLQLAVKLRDSTDLLTPFLQKKKIIFYNKRKRKTQLTLYQNKCEKFKFDNCVCFVKIKLRFTADTRESLTTDLHWTLRSTLQWFYKHRTHDDERGRRWRHEEGNITLGGKWGRLSRDATTSHHSGSLITWLNALATLNHPLPIEII